MSKYSDILPKKKQQPGRSEKSKNNNNIFLWVGYSMARVGYEASGHSTI